MSNMKTIRFNNQETHLFDYWSNNKELVQEIKDFIQEKVNSRLENESIKEVYGKITITENVNLAELMNERKDILEMFKFFNRTNTPVEKLQKKLKIIQDKIDLIIKQNKEVLNNETGKN